MKPKTSARVHHPIMPGRHTSILRHGEELDAIRSLSSSASPISVFAGPSSKVKELVEFGNLDGRPLAYLLCSSTSASAYIGHSGNGERRLGDQVKARPHFDELFVVCFKDLLTGMKPARYLEARSIQLADAAGIKLENVDRPAIPEMTEPERADHERLVYETLFPLRDAGCRIFEKRSAPAQMKNGKNEPVDARIVIGPIKISAQRTHLRTQGQGRPVGPRRQDRRTLLCHAGQRILPCGDQESDAAHRYSPQRA